MIGFSTGCKYNTIQYPVYEPCFYFCSSYFSFHSRWVSHHNHRCLCTICETFPAHSLDNVAHLFPSRHTHYDGELAGIAPPLEAHQRYKDGSFPVWLQAGNRDGRETRLGKGSSAVSNRSKILCVFKRRKDRLEDTYCAWTKRRKGIKGWQPEQTSSHPRTWNRGYSNTKGLAEESESGSRRGERSLASIHVGPRTRAPQQVAL